MSYGTTKIVEYKGYIIAHNKYASTYLHLIYGDEGYTGYSGRSFAECKRIIDGTFLCSSP